MGDSKYDAKTRATGDSERLSVGEIRRDESLCTYDTYDVHPSLWSDLERIQFLLDHWSDIFEPDVASSLSAAGGGSGLDARLPLMAHHRSVVELERCLSQLADLYPVLYRHLKAYRCGAEWRQVRAKIKIKLQSGRTDEIDGWKKERIVPAWISLGKVHLAEMVLATRFQGDVFVPDDLWNGLTKAV